MSGIPRQAGPDSAGSADGGQDCTLEVAADGRVGLTGPLTFETVSQLFRRMEQASPGTAPIEQIDLAGVSAIDSAGLALLLEWQSRARSFGGRLALHNAPESLLRLARLCEAVDLLNISGRDSGRGPERAGGP